MFVVGPAGPQREIGVGHRPLAVGQKRVVAHARRKASFGQSHHERLLEVDAHRIARHGDQHSCTQAPDPTETGLELVEERAPEDRHGRRGLDRIEPGQPLQGRIDLLGRRHLDGRPFGTGWTEIGGQQAGGPP